MLILLGGMIALFFISRTLVLRYSPNSRMAYATATAFVVVFLAGFFSKGILFPEAPAAPIAAVVAPTPAPVSSDPPGKVVLPSDHALSPGQVHALTAVGTPVGFSNIEVLGGGGANGGPISLGATMTVSGWAGDPDKKTAAAGLLIIVDGGKRRYDAGKDYGHARLDVARAFRTMGMLHTGYSISLPTTGLTKGTHTLELGAISANGLHYRLVWSPPKPFTIN